MENIILAEISQIWIGLGVGVVVILGMLFQMTKWYRKVPQGRAIIRTGMGGTKVSFTGMLVVPVLHKMELMDISVKRIEINRKGSDGLICKDNMRADISVVFFVRVNKTSTDVLSVASMIGVDRASNQTALVELFDAKFSEALKTAGKFFNFEDLYTQRQEFRDEIYKIIGADLNGYYLEDPAIDYLEQTPKNLLSPDNILDVVGLEKIATITREKKVLINEQEREEEKTITRQNVDAREKILDMEKELAEAEEKQQLEIDNIKSRAASEAEIVAQQEKLKSEQERIHTEEAVQIAEENKNRQIIVAEKNKQRTEAVETERVEKDREVENTERKRVVEIAIIEKDKAVEVEKKNIQEVIRERVAVERNVVEEQERIKDTEALAGADRQKAVAIKAAEEEGESTIARETKVAEAHKKAAELAADERVYVEVKSAEAAKKSAELLAEKTVIEADADREAAHKVSEGKKALAEGVTAEEAASGLAEVTVMEARADAIEKEGHAEAVVLHEKASAEAKGIHEKAEAMKLFDAVGKEHEEFKLKLNKEKEIELAAINIQAEIATAQGAVIQEGLRHSNIDIVGGESMFFDRMLNSITTAKTTDQLVKKSEVLTDVKETFFDANGGDFKTNLKNFVDKFGVSSEDVKNLTTAALLTKLSSQTGGEDKGLVDGLLGMVNKLGIGGEQASKYLK